MSEKEVTPGSAPTIHHSPADTRERAYERLRGDGIPRETARQIAEQAAREAHRNLDRR